VNNDRNPLVFFSAERTLLAWLRTGLAVVGLGFVVARFGLFLRMMAVQRGDLKPHLGSTMIGVVLVLLGVAASAGGAWQFRRFVNSLSPSDLPLTYRGTWGVWFSIALAVIGMLLAAYLLVQVELN
jgi:putative membrane protein